MASDGGDGFVAGADDAPVPKEKAGLVSDEAVEPKEKTGLASADALTPKDGAAGLAALVDVATAPKLNPLGRADPSPLVFSLEVRADPLSDSVGCGGIVVVAAAGTGPCAKEKDNDGGAAKGPLVGVAKTLKSDGGAGSSPTAMGPKEKAAAALGFSSAAAEDGPGGSATPPLPPPEPKENDGFDSPGLVVRSGSGFLSARLKLAVGSAAAGLLPERSREKAGVAEGSDGARLRLPLLSTLTAEPKSKISFGASVEMAFSSSFFLSGAAEACNGIVKEKAGFVSSRMGDNSLFPASSFCSGPRTALP